MAKDAPLSLDEVSAWIKSRPSWEVRDGWLRRKFMTPGWPHTMMLVQAIGMLAEAAWHHPDLEVGYAQVVVKLQTHRVRAITEMDLALAERIEEIALWRPSQDSPLEGFPKNWIR